MNKIQEVTKILIDRIAEYKILIKALESVPEQIELDYCKEHQTIRCSCQQKIIDSQTKHIKLLQDADETSNCVFTELQAENEKLKEQLLKPCVTCDVFNQNDNLKELLKISQTGLNKLAKTSPVSKEGLSNLAIINKNIDEALEGE